MQVDDKNTNEAMNALLIEKIAAAGGFISFAEFMHHALYAPDLGYYTGGHTKFGAGGDFVTAPEISSLFGRVLARQISEVHEQTGATEILELGAGTGRLAEEILLSMRDLGKTIDYSILEVSPDLAARQRHRLASIGNSLGISVQWRTALPANGFKGVIVANEVLDALPVERFRIGTDGVQQIGVRENDGVLALDERPGPAILGQAVRAIEKDIGRTLPLAYCSEVGLATKPWIQELAGCLGEGLLLFSDYGLGRREYYAEGRSDGTLLCHRQHRAHSDVLLCPGSQDMTAWVDFTAVAEAGTEAGLTLAGFCSQAFFLIGAGIGEELSAAAERDPAHRLQRASEVKTLTLPGEMGERFRFMALTRGIIAPLSGFSEQDLRHQL